MGGYGGTNSYLLQVQPASGTTGALNLLQVGYTGLSNGFQVTNLDGTAAGMRYTFTDGIVSIPAATVSSTLSVTGAFGLAGATPAAPGGITQGGIIGNATSGDTTAGIAIQGSRSVSATFGVLDFTHAGTTTVARIAGMRGSATDEGYLGFHTKATGGSLTERMRLDTNYTLGLGVTPPTWNAGATFQASRGAITGSSAETFVTHNAYYNAGWKYIAGGSVPAARYSQSVGVHTWSYAAGGTNAGDAITWSESVRIDSNGRVGVGTSQTLQSQVTIATSSGSSVSNGDGHGAIRFRSTATAAVGTGPSIIFEGQTGNASPNYGFAAIQGFKASGTAADYSGGIAFFTQSAGGATLFPERARIGGNGEFVVGTTAVNDLNGNTGAVHVEYASSATNISLVRNTNDTAGPRILLGKSRAATAGGRTVVGTSDYLGSILFFGADGTNMVPAASIEAQVDGIAVGTNDMPTRLIFSTTGDADNSPNEAMRIDSSANVGIGLAPSFRLDASASNPARGITARVRNGATSSHTGAQLLFTQNTIADWAIGQPAGTDAFAIWSGRNSAADGTERLRVNASSNVLALDVTGRIQSSNTSYTNSGLIVKNTTATGANDWRLMHFAGGAFSINYGADDSGSSRMEIEPAGIHPGSQTHRGRD